MKLAILGADATLLALARAAVVRSDIDLAYVCELDPTTDANSTELLTAVARSALPLVAWEDLLDAAHVDAVLVAPGNDEDRRSDQIRKLAQAGVPMLLVHPAVSSMLLFYELDMIRRDNGTIVVPYLVDRLHPALGELKAILLAGEGSPIGRVEQITIERPLTKRDKKHVLAHFARDVDLLRKLCGELTHLGAMGTTGDESAYGNLTVQLTGPASNVLARWSVSPAEGGETGDAKLVATGAHGKATLEIRTDNQPWLLTIGGKIQTEFADWDSANAALDLLTHALQRQATDPDLLDAARSVELAETIHRSLARKRTIELHYEDRSEENTFKGTMAAGGCLMLMLGLFLLFIVVILDQAGAPFVRHWPKLLFGLLGIFLLMQLLSLVLRKDPAA